MLETKFFGLLALLVLTVITLACACTTLIQFYPALLPSFCIQIFGLLSSFTLVGLGFGPPLVLLAVLLGWLQLLFLLQGYIDPHLGSEGFIKVIRTLFQQI